MSPIVSVIYFMFAILVIGLVIFSIAKDFEPVEKAPDYLLVSGILLTVYLIYLGSIGGAVNVGLNPVSVRILPFFHKLNFPSTQLATLINVVGGLALVNWLAWGLMYCKRK